MTNKALTPLKSGDSVVVIAGKNKGKTGVITKVITKTSRVIVEGVNMVKRHNKASATAEAGIVEKEAPLHVSNVMLADPKDGKATRVGHKTVDGKKVRYAKRSDTVLEN